MSNSATRRLYNQTAQWYQAFIAPVVGALTDNLLDSIPSTAKPDAFALDLGTGTGRALHRLAEKGWQPIGIDISDEMLSVAHSLGHLRLCQSEITALSFASEAFGLVTSSFSLGLTHPRRALASVRRILLPDGCLIGQEWAAQDALSRIFDDVFDAHCPANDYFLDLSDDWESQMQDTDDYIDQLHLTGFESIDVQEIVLPFTVSVEAFINYRLAWPTYRKVFEQLTRDEQEKMLENMRVSLMSLSVLPDQLLWQPSVFRFSARAGRK